MTDIMGIGRQCEKSLWVNVTEYRLWWHRASEGRILRGRGHMQSKHYDEISCIASQVLEEASDDTIS